MYRILPLLGDIGLGILVIVFVSIFYERYELVVFALLPFALMPDLDTVHEILQRGYVAASAENPHDHRELLHKPIPWLVGGLILWISFGYYGAVIFFLLLFHFIHDSVLTGWGIKWLWPLTHKQYKFFVDEKNEVSFQKSNWIRSWEGTLLKHSIIKYGDDKWIENLYLKPTIVSLVEYSTFVLSIAVLIWYLSV